MKVGYKIKIGYKNKIKILLLSSMIIMMTIIGCITTNTTTNNQISDKFIPEKNLPYGYSYIGIHDTKVEIGESLEKGIEGIYRHNGEDIYIQDVRYDNPKKLLNLYKSTYNNANYNPFEEISINGHNATMVTDYVVINGKQIPKYTVIWITDNDFFIVGMSNDSQSVMTLASATGT